MRAALEPIERARLRQFLVDCFSIDELKDLAFDLAVDFQLFSHDTRRALARELITYLERRHRLSCLVDKVLGLRPDHDNRLAQLSAKLPPCTPIRKLQIIVAENLLRSVNAAEIKEVLAAKFRLDTDEVVIIGAAWGSVRLLVGLPEQVVDSRVVSEIPRLCSGKYQIAPTLLFHSVDLFDSLDPASQEAWRLMARNNPPARQGDMLRPVVSWAETVGRLGGLGPLIEALKHKDKHVRRLAAEALGKIGDARATEPLMRVLWEDDDWYVRRAVAEALGNIQDPSAVECLIAVLEDDEWPVREMAAKALGKIGDARAVGPLIKALKRDWPALWVVAEALGQLEDDRAVESLVAALRDSDGDKYTQQAAVEALGRIGEPIQEPLIDVLRDGDEGARHRAIAALGQMRDARDLTPLIEALRSGPSYEVWQGAVEALVQIGEPAVEPLIAVLQGDDWMARRRAAWALGQIGDTRAMKPLIEALQDQTRFVRQAAAEALERTDTPEARSAVRRYRATYPEE